MPNLKHQYICTRFNFEWPFIVHNLFIQKSQAPNAYLLPAIVWVFTRN